MRKVDERVWGADTGDTRGMDVCDGVEGGSEVVGGA